MGTSRIEQSIEEIYEFIEGCKMQPLSSTKVVVPKDELYDLLDELRMRAPDEIKRYKKVISNREAILEDAQKRADQLVEETRQKTENSINESEIVQQAYFQANQIVSQATEEANRMMAKASLESDQVRMSALAYTNDLLADAEQALMNAYQSANERYEGLMGTIKYALDTIQSNRAELGINNTKESEQKEDFGTYNVPDYKSGEESASEEDDFNFDENTFLDDIK